MIAMTTNNSMSVNARRDLLVFRENMGGEQRLRPRNFEVKPRARGCDSGRIEHRMRPLSCTAFYSISILFVKSSGSRFAGRIPPPFIRALMNLCENKGFSWKNHSAAGGVG
jgi:hypothetical protein